MARGGERAVAIGTSAGGRAALERILPRLPAAYPLPVFIVHHLHPDGGGFLPRFFAERCAMRVKEAEEKEEARPGTIYFAPADYHLLVERDHTLSLSREARVCFSRPAIDVLFESAAPAYGAGLTAVLLTGASSDGSAGAAAVKDYGGTVIVQDPEEAEAPVMPRAAMAAVAVDRIAGLDAIARLLVGLGAGKQELEQGAPYAQGTSQDPHS